MPLEDFWASYGDSSTFEEVACADAGAGSLAIRVLDFYRIPHIGEEIGGELPNLDIKQMDAMQIIRLSLLEYSADNGGIWEPIMNGNGEIEFKNIGSYDSGVEGHIYHQIQTMDYREECKGVMVQGGKPLVVRKPTDWKPIWGTDMPVQIYDLDLAYTNCMSKEFNQYATIVFKDPHLDSSYEDGIDNLYEITKDNPYDSIVGWVYYKEPPQDLVTRETDISYTRSAEIPIEIGLEGGNVFGPNIGTLVKPPTYATGSDPDCWANMGGDVNYRDGVRVPIPSYFRFNNTRGTITDTFVGVTSVYVVGLEISSLCSEPVTLDAAVKENIESADVSVWGAIFNLSETVVRLSEGVHYTIAYDPEEEYKTPYIVFADGSRRNDPATYGNSTTMYIHENCYYYSFSGHKTFEIGTILPIAQTKGIWVKKIFVVIQLNTPSIAIFDPAGNARKIAEGLTYLMSPIVITDEPAPIAYNGRLIDLTQGIKDNDPTTAQNFTDTELELAMDEMQGGGLSLTFSFLESEQCEKLSGELFEYMNSLDGIETVYVCGPETEPQLGGVGPAGGIVNSIQYSYTDSGSYTISVSEGPRLASGFAEVGGGPTPKMAESISGEGTIIQDMGNHIYYKVRIDGFGERVAINCCADILRIGDRVTCGIHNNPVEL